MSKKNKYFDCRCGRALQALFSIGIGVGLILWGVYGFMQHKQIDVDAILANSVLKNRQFASKVQQVESGDLSAYLMEEHSNPIVSISFMFQNSGRAHEPEGKQGLVSVLVDVLKKGAGEYRAETFIDMCSEYGVNISFEAGLDEISGELQFPKKHLQTAVKLFHAVLTAPHFEEKYLQLSKEQHVLAITMKQEKIRSFAADKFKEIYFAGHPYAKPTIGTIEDIQTLSADDLRQYMQNTMARDNLLVAVAGDLTADETAELLRALFADLPAQANVHDLAKIQIKSNGQQYYNAFRAAQMYVMFAVPGVYRQDADFYPLYLANYIFGSSGLEARLNKSIREKEGLTYGLYTYLGINDASSRVEGAFSATPENLPRAMELLEAEWRKMGEGTITAEELQKAKDSILASSNLRYAAIDGISDLLLRMQEYNLGIDFLEKREGYIKQTTLQQVNDAARKYFSVLPDFVITGEQNKENN